MSEAKRLNYFNSQFLKEKDFQDEQTYHLQMRRLHNQRFHTWGIVSGLEIERVNNAEISLSPGLAVDRQGRELPLTENPPNFSVVGFSAAAVVYLTLAYDEVFDIGDRNPSGDTEKFVRITERPKLETTTQVPPTDGSVIVLGRVTLSDAGNVTTGGIDRSVRSPIASAVIAPEAINTEQLAPASITTVKVVDGAITTAKLPDSSVTTPKLANGAVITAKIAPNAVGSAQLANGAIGANQLAASAVGTAQLANGAVTLDKLNTTVSTAFLPVSGGTITGGDLTLKATANDAGDIIFQDSANRQKGRIWSNPASNVSGLFLSSGDNTADISIDQNGNVGIGITNPSAKLHVAGGGTVLEQESWQTPTLQNGWVRYDNTFNPPGYFKDSVGIVHLRGLVRSGTIGAVIFTLPSGYRPQFQELFSASTSPNSYARVDVTAAGAVVATTGNNGWLSLDGITFRVSSGFFVLDPGIIFNPGFVVNPVIGQ
ncbi:hypothetical protein PGN35_009020 [Nodosilinea sp. PGN35]|uniref:hypothetical protein n=1 Tax=Nodosilinea sp. PGN35 TaxID=3020489 RepID=UPI0023B26FF9|nr:hypothetical protein [Nodosilinea sp. TSF1-S3]MDF0367879.1 hypothetical protein [Nodosilinea sp. TSF1-S3]